VRPPLTAKAKHPREQMAARASSAMVVCRLAGDKTVVGMDFDLHANAFGYDT
jgi:hypothetical protein